MLTNLRFLLYCLATIAGATGLWIGGLPVFKHAIERVSGSYSVNYGELFRFPTIFLLSLILLVLVHIGYRLAGAFHLPPTKRPISDSSKEKSPRRGLFQ